MLLYALNHQSFDLKKIQNGGCNLDVFGDLESDVSCNYTILFQPVAFFIQGIPSIYKQLKVDAWNSRPICQDNILNVLNWDRVHNHYLKSNIKHTTCN